MYGVAQGRGQLKIIFGSEPVEDFLKDPNYPDSLKAKLKLVAEIKSYATDSLGINPSENYEKLFDQKGKPVMWVVTGCNQDSLVPYKWSFPFLGEFSYKGFFDKEKAQEEYEKLVEEGYDADVGIVNAWSTLGWFKDPIMSSMLEKSPGQLARVIIHELTHGTLFVKNDIQFNENLASFVGDKGAVIFLRSKYGEDSPEMKSYMQDMEDMATVRSYLLGKTSELKSFYSTASKDEVKQLKREKIKSIILGVDSLKVNKPWKYKKIIAQADSINNTFFTSFLTYREDQNKLENEFQNTFNSDFKKYLDHLKEKYPSL